MTRVQFRYLLALYVLVTAAHIALGLSGAEHYSDALAKGQQEPYAWLHGHAWLFTFLFVALFGPCLAVMAGLYKVKHWARALALYATIAGLLITPFAGATQYSPMESFFMEASTMLWGGILAIAYFGPLSVQFASSRSTVKMATPLA